MDNPRTEALIGRENAQKLKDATVAVIGVGGVGGFAVEALARSGVGRLILVDKDTVEPSNRNRQLCALQSTVGQSKTQIFKERIADINPETEVIAIDGFYDKEMNDKLADLKPDFVIDCIDSLGSKMDLIRFCLDEDVPFLVSCGMARKTDPSKIEITELEKTSYDPIAKKLRVWKRKNRIRDKIWVCSSTEKPVELGDGPLPSMIFVPGSAGLLLASTAVQKLLEKPVRKAESLKAAPANPEAQPQN